MKSIVVSFPNEELPDRKFKFLELIEILDTNYPGIVSKEESILEVLSFYSDEKGCGYTFKNGLEIPHIIKVLVENYFDLCFHTKSEN